MENYGQKFQSPQQYHIYHSFRKDTKKFRYSLEFFSSVYNFLPYYTLVNELIVLQDQLGFLNDCVVAHEFLTEHLNSELLLKKSKDIESIEKYISFRISEKNLIIESLPDLWEDFQLAKPSLLLSHSLAPLTT
jgi:CHAD domain-containing protein